MAGTTGDQAAALFSRALHGADARTGGGSPAVGGFLVCLDVPSATELGVDYEVFRTGPKFQGVKFLPLGIHFVLFRSREQEHGIRQGFFVNVERHAQVIVREWSLEKEELGPPRPGLNVENLERAVLSFQLDSGLGPYPKEHLKTWRRLSNFISASVLQRCGVEFGGILLPGDAVEDAATSSKTQDGVIPYFPDLPRTVRFTVLQKTRTDLSPEARTAYHFDRSERLEELIETEFSGDWKELVGELQLSFLVFLQLSSLAALGQWKQFIALMSSCERALSSQVPLFLSFIKLLRTQLEQVRPAQLALLQLRAYRTTPALHRPPFSPHFLCCDPHQIPEDFFQDETTSENFLSPCLLSLLELIEDDDAPPQLRQKASHLRQLLASRFHWDPSAELELDELAPVVVPAEELSFAATQDATAAPSPLPPFPPAASTALRRQQQQQDEERANATIAAAFLGS
ncbi:a1-alpha2 repression [Phytophthora pseudosyringae]|uniref:A1-alpha2 repression n=1 Tax=Phytophthora pseudosyringae TaxID=221518 RepID=A0A8T1WCY6_9STRA|nr:a1-alpha2 repression [Phytophthora pseudosyringae]